MAHLKKIQRATSNNLKKMDKDEYTELLDTELITVQSGTVCPTLNFATFW